jgi:hypothetical protein
MNRNFFTAPTRPDLFSAQGVTVRSGGTDNLDTG